MVHWTAAGPGFAVFRDPNDLEVEAMTSSFRRISPWLIAVGVILLIGSPSWAFAKKGLRISVGDDPSMKEGSPELVLIEVSDYQ